MSVYHYYYCRTVIMVKLSHFHNASTWSESVFVKIFGIFVNTSAFSATLAESRFKWFYSRYLVSLIGRLFPLWNLRLVPLWTLSSYFPHRLATFFQLIYIYIVLLKCGQHVINCFKCDINWYDYLSPLWKGISLKGKLENINC